MRLTTIDGVPLYSTLQEALQWAALNNLKGYHTHIHQGSLGYMGGATHARAIVSGSTTTTTSVQSTSSGSTNMNTPSSSPSSGSSGGGGY
tara:strand:+ start:306 stop:575 length:270 start_codon:yes stop_codon:yes gene_type:complete